MGGERTGALLPEALLAMKTCAQRAFKGGGWGRGAGGRR